MDEIVTHEGSTVQRDNLSIEIRDQYTELGVSVFSCFRVSVVRWFRVSMFPCFRVPWFCFQYSVFPCFRVPYSVFRVPYSVFRIPCSVLPQNGALTLTARPPSLAEAVFNDVDRCVT